MVTKVKDINGKLSHNDKEAASILCDKFSQVFVNHESEDISGMSSPCIASSDVTFVDELFTEDVVYRKLCLLNPSKSPGPDSVHPHLLKNCADILAAPLTCLFAKSLQENCLPEEWKLANIMPLFKKGSKLDPENYRPVSLTSVPCKIMESIIRDYGRALIEFWFSHRLSAWIYKR